MFSRRKEELHIMQKSLESLENSQKNTELMLNTMRQMIEKENDMQEISKSQEISDEEKRRAAYALNLCMVSVSQIIDYNDENILEQEYETILNNLNLENMPKDEALLNILKQILDTVTFFRIQEGDKAFIEKEYQHKIKNAIWSAIPNLGLIIAGKNPFTIAISLASQVGIGYMNYRKTKAKIDLGRERREWELQRAAVEQLNGLRRELFDASWRLADRYGFKDEYRLTERQITQYNEILMDSDDIRKYERLEAVSEYFVAYPSFWYQFGHAANAIAQNALRDNELDINEKYKKLAIQHFDKFLNSDKYALLREDQITSSCALEYIDLLDVNSEKDRIKELLDRAIKMSGRACDILQICSITYLRIGKMPEAIALLKYLVNENYNIVTNAQLLSSIYVSGMMGWNMREFMADYKILQKRIPAELLFPFPEENDSIDSLKEEFVKRQQAILNYNYDYVIRNYYEKCSVRFNKIIPVPDAYRKYSDSFFSDIIERKEERLSQYRVLLSNKNKADDFLSRLIDSNFALEFLEIFNEMVNDIEELIPGDLCQKQEYIRMMVESIEDAVTKNKEKINKLQSRMNNDFGDREFRDLFSLTFDVFTQRFFAILITVLKKHISEIKDMSEISSEETMLRDFCINKEIPEFKIIIENRDVNYDEYTGKKIYFSSELLGGEIFVNAEINTMFKKMAKLIDESKENQIISKNNQKIYFYTKIKDKDNFQAYFIKGRKKYYVANKELKKKIIAVLVNKSIGFGVMDLVFTIDGIICDKFFTGFNDNPSIIKYDEVRKENDGLLFGNDVYINKEVDISKLFDLIQEFAEIVSKNHEKICNEGAHAKVLAIEAIDDTID